VNIKNVRGMCSGLVATMAWFALPTTAWAQFGKPWERFEDPQTGDICGVVNTSNANLTVVAQTGEVILITGRDRRLNRLFVDEDNNVFYNGFAAGQILFADDADGYPAVFWMTDRGTVVKVDERTGEPSDSRLLPEEIGNTGCDPCGSIDDDPLCDRNPIDDNAGLNIWPILCGTGAAPGLLLLVVALPLLGRMHRCSR